jgi:hypothetical protein
MKFHSVTKEEPGFALVVAKNGPKLHTSTSKGERLTFLGPNGEELPKPMGNAVKVKAQKCSVSALKDLVAFAGKIGPGVDKTGLTGVYDFTLSWNEEGGPSLSRRGRHECPHHVFGSHTFHDIRRSESRLGPAGSTGIAGETGEGAGRPVCPGFRTKAHAQLASRFWLRGNPGEVAGSKAERRCPNGPPDRPIRFVTALQSPHQIHNPHVERIGQDLERLKRDVALSTLDRSHVCPVQPRFVGKHVLRPPALLPECPHLGPDLFLDGLHQQQFGGTLFLHILVITSMFKRRELEGHGSFGRAVGRRVRTHRRSNVAGR